MYSRKSTGSRTSLVLTAALLFVFCVSPHTAAETASRASAEYAETTISLLKRGLRRIELRAELSPWRLQIAVDRLTKYQTAVDAILEIRQELPNVIRDNISWQSSGRNANQLLDALIQVEQALQRDLSAKTTTTHPSEPLETLRAISEQFRADENDLNLPVLLMAMRFEEAFVDARAIESGVDDSLFTLRQRAYVARFRKMLDPDRRWSLTHLLSSLHGEQHRELAGLITRALRGLQKGTRWGQCGQLPTNPEIRSQTIDLVRRKPRFVTASYFLLLLEALIDQAYTLSRNHGYDNDLTIFVKRQKAYRTGITEAIAVFGNLINRSANHISGAVPEDLRFKSRRLWTASDKQRYEQRTATADSAKRKLMSDVVRIKRGSKDYNDYMMERLSSQDRDVSHPRSLEMDERRPILDLFEVLESVLRTYRELRYPGDEKRYYERRRGNRWPHRIETGQLNIRCCTTLNPMKVGRPPCNWRDQ